MMYNHYASYIVIYITFTCIHTHAILHLLMYTLMLYYIYLCTLLMKGKASIRILHLLMYTTRER